MSFNWKSIVGAVAPVLGTALGGPLGGMAVKAIGDALGLSDATEATVSGAIQGATPDQLAAIKKADQDFAVKMKSLDIDLEKIGSEDRDSARKMQIETKSWTPHVLALVITVGFFGILIGLLSGVLSSKDSPELLLLIGSLSTAWGMVVSFFYGSSSGSQGKDSTISKMAGR